ncbi:MAG: type II toxin-antitoxin system VapC family toxin [Acidiferrobacterales bacterium]
MVVLDTNALIFDALNPARLSRKARGLIERAHTRNDLCCSDISLWEIAMLVAKGRLDPGTGALEFMNLALTARSIAMLPITPEIAELSTRLPEAVSADPADRLIAATAIHHGAMLISTDINLKKAALSVAVVG